MSNILAIHLPLLSEAKVGVVQCTKKLEYKIEEVKELTHQIMSSVRLVLSTKSNLNQIDNIKIEI